jgi:hypothetical protein
VFNLRDIFQEHNPGVKELLLVVIIKRSAPVELHIRICSLGLLYEIEEKRVLYLVTSSIHLSVT